MATLPTVQADLTRLWATPATAACQVPSAVRYTQQVNFYRGAFMPRPQSAVVNQPKQFVQIRPSSPPVVGQCMVGIVVSHPFHAAGTEVVTSPVLSIDGQRVQTRSSVYELR